MENLLPKEHAHTFVNTGGDVRLLDFRFKLGGLDIGAPFHGKLLLFVRVSTGACAATKVPGHHRDSSRPNFVSSR